MPRSSKQLDTTKRESTTCRRLPVSKGIRPRYKQHVGFLPDEISRGPKLYKSRISLPMIFSFFESTHSKSPTIKFSDENVLHVLPMTIIMSRPHTLSLLFRVTARS